MRVIRAQAMGMCFGVKDALQVAFSRDDAAEVTVYGELVHNEAVLRDLGARGFQLAPEQGREAALGTRKVLITAHGISNREKRRLRSMGKELIDTTCPLVTKVHDAAMRLADAGYFPVICGKRGHVEVRGVIEDLDEFAVVESVSEAEAMALKRPRIGVVCQSTFPEPVAEAIVRTLERLNPEAEVRFLNTVCDPTRRRRQSVAELAAEAEVVVVVGGRHSNNTRELVRSCREVGVPAHQVQGPDDLDPEWFAGRSVVGLTAGTSTQDAVVDAVEAGILARATAPIA